MDRLRSPGGCPWDAEQTQLSLLPYLIEESYELVEAVETGDDPAHIREELGDVLLQVLFHARIAQERAPEEGRFDIDDVVRGLTDKLRRRHPHVFSDSAEPLTAIEVHARWDALKRAEKPERTGPFDGVPPGLPALALAAKTMSKARKAGLDHTVPDEPVPDEDSADTEAELGRALFALVRRACSNGIDPERALRRTTREYRDRLSASIAQASGT